MSVIRARPLLGTRVDIRVDGLAEMQANAAIDAGFAAIGEIHRLMSFHEPASDVSRLNRDAVLGPVRVSAQTFAVLARAQEISEASGGLFDISTARQLVAWDYLPRPAGPAPAVQASWRDILLADDMSVRFARPLWIDLGGIAKGYAVDRAIQAMNLGPTVQCIVNAGGDLRVAGPRAERIALRVPFVTEQTSAPPLASEGIPAIEIADGSLASSSGREHARERDGGIVGPHVDGVSGGSTGTNRFVSVAAADCVVADALTKVVMAAGAGAEAVLRRFGAAAYMFEAEGNGRGSWTMMGEGNT
jgi:thiamine biosynthesis lipoprotein